MTDQLTHVADALEAERLRPIPRRIKNNNEGPTAQWLPIAARQQVEGTFDAEIVDEEPQT